MKAKTPPLITPFAILSVILLLGTTNVVENHVTHTHEGRSIQPARVVNNQNRQPNSNVPNRSVTPAHPSVNRTGRVSKQPNYSDNDRHNSQSRTRLNRSPSPRAPSSSGNRNQNVNRQK